MIPSRRSLTLLRRLADAETNRRHRARHQQKITFDFDAPNEGEESRCCYAALGRILGLERCPNEAYRDGQASRKGKPVSRQNMTLAELFRPNGLHTKLTIRAIGMELAQSTP